MVLDVVIAAAAAVVVIGSDVVTVELWIWVLFPKILKKIILLLHLRMIKYWTWLSVLNGGLNIVG